MSKARVYVYGYKNNPVDVAARITAVSRRQADYKLGLKKGKAYVEEALEKGYLHLMRVEDVPPRKPRKPKKSRWAKMAESSSKKFEAMKAAGRVYWDD